MSELMRRLQESAIDHGGTMHGDLLGAALCEIEMLRKDAERFRYLRNRSPADVLQTTGDAAGCWIDCEAGDELTLLTGEDADAAIDAAMQKDKP